MCQVFELKPMTQDEENDEDDEDTEGANQNKQNFFTLQLSIQRFNDGP